MDSFWIMTYWILIQTWIVTGGGGVLTDLNSKLWRSDYLFMSEIYELDTYMYFFPCHDEVDMILLIFQLWRS